MTAMRLPTSPASRSACAISSMVRLVVGRRAPRPPARPAPRRGGCRRLSRRASACATAPASSAAWRRGATGSAARPPSTGATGAIDGGHRRHDRRDRRRAFGAIDVAGEELAGGDEAGREEQGRERRDQDDRQLLREIRRVRDDRARDDARIRRDRADAVARASPRGTWRDRIRAGRAAPWPRARARAARTSCSLVEAACCLSWSRPLVQLLDPRAGDAGVVLERAHEPLAPRRGSGGRGRRSAPSAP